MKIHLDIATGTWTGITETDRQLWAKAYPAVDIDMQLAKAVVWCRANGARGRKSDWKKFVNGWLSRAQDKPIGKASEEPERNYVAERIAKEQAEEAARKAEAIARQQRMAENKRRALAEMAAQGKAVPK